MRIEGNRILGPGVADMKDGLLAGIYALRALQWLGLDTFGTVHFFCNSEEEVGSPMSRRLYPRIAARCDAALVLESGRPNGDIVTARKGSAFYTLTAVVGPPTRGSSRRRGPAPFSSWRT